MTGFNALDALALALGVAGGAVVIAIVGALLARHDRKRPHVCWEDATECADCAPFDNYADARKRAGSVCVDCNLPRVIVAGEQSAPCSRCGSNWLADNPHRIASIHASAETIERAPRVLIAHNVASDPVAPHTARELREQLQLADSVAFVCDPLCADCMAYARSRYADETGH